MGSHRGPANATHSNTNLHPESADMPIQISKSLKRTRTEEVPRAIKRSKPAQIHPPRSGVSSGSASDPDEESDGHSDSEDEAEDDKQAMLAALEAHGRAMFASLDSPKAGPSTPAQKSKMDRKEAKKAKVGKQMKQEMTGLDGIFSEDSEEDPEFEEGEGFDEDDGDDGISGDEDEEEEEGDMDDVMEHEEEKEEVQTVVFGGDAGRSTLDSTTKADMKRFMSSKSSKMMNIQKPDEDVPGRRKKGSVEEQAEEEEDRSNAALDKELHGLLVNSLLPGATTAVRPSEKKNQMSSRLLELASIAGLGEGSSTLHSTAYKTQPTKIRSNILKAQERRQEKSRAEAQASGSWVKGSGGLGDTGGKSGLTLAARKRQEKEKDRRSKSDERGLSMGVGRFKGGVLTLSKSEIAKGSAVPEKFSVGKKKGKGGKKGGKK